MPRDYSALLTGALVPGRRGDGAAIIDRLWDHLAPTGISWIGIYYFAPRAFPDADGMVLGPCRDKPACSPIGLHGACGRAFISRRTLVVTDVSRLGANYVACDPRDRSELVIPLMDSAGAAVGVLDADSFDPGAFTEHDARETARVLHAHGLLGTDPGSLGIDVV